MNKLAITLDRKNEPQFFEDTFNDLSADIEERIAREHLSLKLNERFLIIGSRKAFDEWLERYTGDASALIQQMKE